MQTIKDFLFDCQNMWHYGLTRTVCIKIKDKDKRLKFRSSLAHIQTVIGLLKESGWNTKQAEDQLDRINTWIRKLKK